MEHLEYEKLYFEFRIEYDGYKQTGQYQYIVKMIGYLLFFKDELKIYEDKYMQFEIDRYEEEYGQKSLLKPVVDELLTADEEVKKYYDMINGMMMHMKVDISRMQSFKERKKDMHVLIDSYNEAFDKILKK